jgi:UDP:flavonoid glycosyltransferase YjiC (YdhE family)
MSTRYIVLATWGSFGDLHPYVAIGLELQRRGHRVTLATASLYRGKVETLGLGYAPLRPDLPAPSEAGEIIRRVMDLRHGTGYLFEELLMPHLRESFDDLLRAAEGADLLVTHPVTFAAPLVAQAKKLRWVSTVLAPASLFSVHDPPVPPLPALAHLFRLGLPVRKAYVAIARRITGNWLHPVQQLRRELGLPCGSHPLFEGQHSPYRVLALFSRALGAPQRDWPANTKQTGFAFYDQRGEITLPQPDAAHKVAASIDKGDRNGSGMSTDLSTFLNDGEAPIVFTLGSSAVMDAGEFYRESATAARLLGRRAVLLAGSGEALPRELPPGVAAFDYAPYSELFPRAAAIVHQGGVGTTGQAMRAGVPMLVMPYSHDQPDHAARMVRLGIGRQIARSRYTAGRAARELERLLTDGNYARRATAIGEQVRREDGVGAACDAIEEQLP